MKRAAVLVILALVVASSPETGWAKKKEAYPMDDQGNFLPPGQAKPKGPPPWAPAHGYRAKQKYRYYPAYNLYQDPVSGLFFSFRAGAWAKGPLPPGVDPGRLGRYREFDGYVDEPWKSHPPAGKKKGRD